MHGIDYQQFDLPAWIEYIQHQHKRTMDLTLDRVIQVWGYLGKPQGRFNIVVAGTNGKGSSISMLESVLLYTDRVTGVYTSPHLTQYNERIKINGHEVADESLCQAFIKVNQARGTIPLTYFEYSTLCALWLFAEHNVEIALLEVGMGGRLDAVNVVDNDIALITSIGLDHELWLGSDRESIGKEKAGIIKDNGCVVFAGKEMPNSIATIAQNRGAQLLVAGDDYYFTANETLAFQSNHALVAKDYSNIDGLPLVLGAGHQIDNLAGVIAVLALISERFAISPKQVIEGLKQTKISGRCQIFGNNPLLVVDVAHNADAVQQLVNFLISIPCSGNRLAVFGALIDKALEPILEPVRSLFSHWYLVDLGGERGQTAVTLNAKMRPYINQCQMTNCFSPVAGYEQAKQAATAQDQIIVFGSFYNAGAIIAYLI